MKRVLRQFVKKFSGFIFIFFLGSLSYISSGNLRGFINWLWAFKWLIGPLVIMAILAPFWPNIKGAYGEYRVKKILSKLDPTQYKIINNLFLKLEDGKTSQIDHVVISTFGVFVIETKNYSGMIIGDDRSEYWIQTFFKNKKRFLNPTWQNNGHVKALKEDLKDFGDILYMPIVVFSNNANLSRVTSGKVITVKELSNFIGEKQQKALDENIMNNIYDRLTKIRIKDKKELKKHIAGIKENVENKSHICPKCGSALVSKQGKYGAFIGCSGYPKCRYIYKGDNLN